MADKGQPPLATAKPRLLFLDALRGLALIAMASYHFSWDLEFFGYLEPGTSTQGAFRLYARAIASSFLFLAGFSLVLAHYPQLRPSAFLRRLGIVALAAAAISAATFWFTPAAWIFFGILHAIALCSVIGLAFLRVPPVLTIIVAGIVLALPSLVSLPAFDHPFLLFLGLSERLPRSNDFVPLMPWLGALLCGIAAARFAVDRNMLDQLARLPPGPAWLRFGGRHSLTVYLLHQPVLIALLYLGSLVIPPPSPDPVADYLSSCQQACSVQGNDPGLCTRFCDCTLDALKTQSLLEPLQSGAILPEQDARIKSLAAECTAISRAP